MDAVPLNEDGDIDQTAFVRFAKAQETFARVQTQEQARNTMAIACCMMGKGTHGSHQ